MIVGIDVSKDKLDVFVSETNQHHTIKNTKAAIGSFFKSKLKNLSVDLVVFEATGGYERLLQLYVSDNGIAYHKAHALRVKRFGQATGFFAKTDKQDASLLARYGSQEQVKADKPISQKQLECHRSARLVESIKKQLQSAKNQVTMACTKEERQYHKSHIRFLERELVKAREAFDLRIDQQPELREKRELLQTMKGVGREISAMLIACLPELGEISREAVSCLVGVAPKNNDSGIRQGRRQISHGRFHVRKALYMAALVSIRHNPKMKAFYEKLLAKGRAKKVAIIAVARKVLITLNAMVRTGTPWRPNFNEI